MNISKDGVDFIKRWEGCRLKAYLDKVANPPVWTIGYGVTTAAGFGTIKAGMQITQAIADEWLIEGLKKYETAVSRSLTKVPFPHQFDAMVSLCWNIGPGAFAKSSVVRRFNAGDTMGAADAFLMWNKAGGKASPGLTNRRKAERLLFMKASTTSILPPPPDVEFPPEIAPLPSPKTTGKVVAGTLIGAAIAAILSWFFGG